jgi:tRNA uridine 5-carboxymethylaminomethyl modification enzyme
LISDKQALAHESLLAEIAAGKTRLESNRIRVSKDTKVSVMEYLKRPDVTWESLDHELLQTGSISDRAIESLEVEAKYEGYLGRQEKELLALSKLKAWRLDPAYDIDTIPSLSMEVVEKYKKHKPNTVYELSQISGMPPTAVLLIAKSAAVAPSKNTAQECFT